MEALLKLLNRCIISHTHQITMHTCIVGIIQWWDLFHSAQARGPMWEQFEGGRNSRKYGNPKPVLMLFHQHVHVLLNYAPSACIYFILGLCPPFTY